MNRNQNYNPDVLNCLANLSNDEVFTPPELANKMLDLLPQELFQNPNTTFLDPFTKSGVFLREIVKRLDKGLEKLIPDRQERIDHILQKQVFGIAITELTSLLARRSVYCSKDASSKYSISKFPTASGNILYKNIKHTWVNGKCKYCGASQAVYDRGSEAEQYAYMFIHTDNPKQFFPNMKFDVIVGNPPYQLDTGGAGRQAKPLYNLFVEQAKKLKPQYIVMIMPSRWFAGGMGLDDFRNEMMSDNCISHLVDYTNAKDCFPQNSISGGVCYFAWERKHKGKCHFINIRNGKRTVTERPLNEFPVLVRYNEAVEILHKTRKPKEHLLQEIVSSLTPYGLPTNYRGHEKETTDDLTLYSSEGISYMDKKDVTKGFDSIEKYKVMISKMGAEHAGEPSKDGMFRVLTSTMRVLMPNEVCTHSYFVIGPFNRLSEGENLLSYLRTKFVRFLIMQCMSAVNLSKAVFAFVPLQDFSHPWTDEMLYKKYGLTEEEITFIESMIRPME